MKRILGLDLGTNSIGWAVISCEGNTETDIEHGVIEDSGKKEISGAGSRIIPMDAATIGDYEKGNLQSSAADRTKARGMRRLYERSALRRERLLRVLNILGFLPQHFREAIDFADHPGKFKDNGEPLIAYDKNGQGHRRFIFMNAFQEMLADFNVKHPELLVGGRRVPYDWTIYYLRKKALTRPIAKEELAWILLNFNAKRGYYQLRGEDMMPEDSDEKSKKEEEYMELTVTRVEKMEADKKDPSKFWYEITYENGAKQRVKSPAEPRKIGDKVEVIVTTTYDKDGNIKVDKDGNKSIKLRTPKEEDWTLRKKRTEHNIDVSGKTVGEFIYDNILATPYIKVRGKLVHTIERKYYRAELSRILDKQKEYFPELSDAALLERCARELYKNNEKHVKHLMSKNFTYLFVEDIVFYQRPLKSKKSEISDCPYEARHYCDKLTGEIITVPLKCILKSHPLYQEFRLWQFVENLRIYKREGTVNGKLETNIDETKRFLPNADAKAGLFEWLNGKKEIKQDQLLAYAPFGLRKKEIADYRWNYVEDKTYPCNETEYEINRRTDKIGVVRFSDEDLFKLWHLEVSVTDPVQNDKAVRSFARKRGIDEKSFAEAFKNYTPDRTSYGAYSEKAIKKLLALMRAGKYWSADAIDPHTRERIDNIINGVADDSISERVRNLPAIKDFDDISKFSGMPVWLACYIVYNRHSEAYDLTRWEKPSDITTYLNTVLRHNSLRNPIVEKVVTETLKVVKDLWETYGKIDEVHVEMGRNLRNNAQQRKDATERILNGESTNLRIRILLQEFANPEYGIQGVRPYSPTQQEKMKIFEDGILSDSSIEKPAEILAIIKELGDNRNSAKVNASNVKRYRLWLEQRYRSPYTGCTIPLSRLFTTEYEIEHVIPQSRYFDDSLTNKIVCESEVNKDKGNMLGYEYVTKCGGKIIQVFQNGEAKSVTILDKNQYEDFVKQHYRGKKMKNLLMDDIPISFIQRQMNDTRYMSRKIKEILSMLVREEGEEEAMSKNVIATSGAITDKLKQDWGLKDVWNHIITPRFERLNKMTNTSKFGQWTEKDGKRYFQINMPVELSAGFNKKRIDHRHHAMDAIVIAFTTRNHINYLNNVNAAEGKEKQREDLKHKLCYKGNDGSWTFKKPYDMFTQDVRQCLQGIIVSFKQNLRIISHTSNFYTHYDADGKKTVSKQTKGDGWAIRKSLHKATVSGLVRLQQKKKVRLAEALNDWRNICDRQIRKEVKRIINLYKGNANAKTLSRYFKDRGYKVNGKDISKVEIYYFTDGDKAMTASRVAVDDSFGEKNIAKITDSGIRKIMRAHLHRYDDADGKEHPELAFSPEGIATMNRDIRQLNGGKDHNPILKVRKAEPRGMKFPVGERGTKGKKFVEADKGTNLFFAIYADENGKRSYDSIPFNVAVERYKAGLAVAPDIDDKGTRLLFTLSPQDLVYVPEEGENVDIKQLNPKRIYKMVSCTGKQCYFVPATNANVIVDGIELESLNKMEKTVNGTNIKQSCMKLAVDRLGRITKIYM